MIRTFDSETERFLSALQASQARSSQALAQISTGLKVTRPSDAPADVIDIIRWDARLSRGGQVGANLSTARTEADTADATLQTAIGLLEEALQIGSQGTAVMQNANSRAGLAAQVRQLHQQMLNLTQLNVQGRYIFSGDHDQQAQYALDPANPETGVARAFMAGETRRVTDLIGGGFQAAMTAEEIFDHRNADDTVAVDNAFAALTSLAQALDADDGDAITASIAKVKQSLDHLNLALSFYGGVSNRIISSASMVERYQLQWKESLSEKRDADLIQAATDLQASRTQQEAAMAARARFSGRSLFDFL